MENANLSSDKPKVNESVSRILGNSSEKPDEFVLRPVSAVQQSNKENINSALQQVKNPIQTRVTRISHLMNTSHENITPHEHELLNNILAESLDSSETSVRNDNKEELEEEEEEQDEVNTFIRTITEYLTKEDGELMNIIKNMGNEASTDVFDTVNELKSLINKFPLYKFDLGKR